MNIDERIAKLAESQERTEAMQHDTQLILAGVLDSIKRLERIALSHEVPIQDVEATLAALEGRSGKPQ